jgi:hypothetical protein
MAEYASAVSPIDEANIFPRMHASFTNNMPIGLCRTVLSTKEAQQSVIAGAHDRFTDRNHPLAASLQDDLRYEMQDHLRCEMKGELYALDDPEPQSLLEGVLLRMVDTLYPHQRQARKQRAAELRIEQMVAKLALARSSVLGAMLKQVINATADERQAA